MNIMDIMNMNIFLLVININNIALLLLLSARCTSAGGIVINIVNTRTSSFSSFPRSLRHLGDAGARGRLGLAALGGRGRALDGDEAPVDVRQAALLHAHAARVAQRLWAHR